MNLAYFEAGLHLLLEEPGDWERRPGLGDIKVDGNFEEGREGEGELEGFWRAFSFSFVKAELF